MKQKRIKLFLVILMALFIFQNVKAQPAQQTNKYLIILQAGTKSPDGMARAVHALLYTEELAEHGHDVLLVFDGAGTQWIEKWLSDETSKYADMYLALAQKGTAVVVCDYCAGAFGVKESLQKHDDANLVGEFKGHPSIAKYANQGYQLIIL